MIVAFSLYTHLVLISLQLLDFYEFRSLHPYLLPMKISEWRHIAYPADLTNLRPTETDEKSKIPKPPFRFKGLVFYWFNWNTFLVHYNALMEPQLSGIYI